ncbi:ABC transporter permease [Boudabousia tangfeifanii]|uniref:ABC transporter permease n=1 Tax=Boudabousia tangfeifanii TaxID=1912795 RepID=A0A1D9MLE2_9ACTO|nr:ABC transporter permease [Boudabousia tangfeifanii]AOZ72993.1 ABC transporter permease [Boudabousia tangfeifanii]
MSQATNAPQMSLPNEPTVATIKTKMKLRDPITTSVLALLTGLLALRAEGVSRLAFEGATSWFNIPDLVLNARLTVIVCFLINLAAAAYSWKQAAARKPQLKGSLFVVGVLFVLAFLVWTVAGKPDARMPIVSLLVGALTLSIPLIYGSLSGVVCERTGVINIAIEGQLLFGAFLGAVVASLTNNAYVGLLGAALGGALVGVLLALFTVKLRTDHIIVGVVLNMLVLGLTSFMYSTVLKSSPTLNQVVSLPKLRIPFLADIPFLGPLFFNQSILVYLMYVAVIGLQWALFHTKWGLRTRACGEHPKAADTVGIKVNRMRWTNVIAASALAGLGGAFFTLGASLAFSKNMSSGNGFIALAAMIIGRWNPKGAVAAALLFGFATNLGSVMQAVGSPLPAEYMLMLPYVVTVLAVAGFVGAVRAPAAEGKAYPE